MKLLAIVGSPRLDGNNNYLVDRALEEASKMGAETEKIVLNQCKVSPCLGHEDCASFDSCQQQDDAGWILDKFCEADGIILATPVYYYNVSAWMKAFIDRNYFLYKHNRKSGARVVGIIVVAGGDGFDDTLHTLRNFINESFDINEDRIFEVCGSATKPGEAKGDSALVEDARQMGRRMVASLKQDS